MSTESAVAQYMLSGAGSTFMRQGIVSAYHAGPPPSCDVEINCEGLFSGIGVATPRAPFVGETVWIIEQNGKFVIMGIQQNAVPPADYTDPHYDPVSNSMQGPMIHGADLRSSTFRYGTYIGGTFTSSVLDRPTITNPIIVGGTFNGAPMADNVSGSGANIVRPNLEQPVIQSPTFDGGAEILNTGAIRSANYLAGSEGWAIGGNGTAEFNNLLVRNSGIIGGVALGLSDIDGQMDGGSIASVNFVSGVTGWAIDGQGNSEFNSGYFRGAIAGGNIDIGGADASSFHVDAVGNMWLGAATYAAAPFKVSAAGGLTALSGNINGTLRTGTTGARVDIGASYSAQISLYDSNPPPAVGSKVPGGIGGYPLGASGGQLVLSSPQYSTSLAGPNIALSQWTSINGKGLMEFTQMEAAIFGGQLRTLGGTASAPGHSFTDQPNMGMWRSGLNDLSFSPNGAAAMTLNPTNMVLGGTGISYNGTNGTGTPNSIGLKWSSPNFIARVDNAVEAIIGTASDRRLKHDIYNLDGWDALQQIMGLRPKTFEPLDFDGSRPGHRRRAGLIADEVQGIVPWAVPPVSGDDYQTVDYLGLVTVLVSAVQELSNKINELEGR